MFDDINYDDVVEKILNKMDLDDITAFYDVIRHNHKFLYNTIKKRYNFLSKKKVATLKKDKETDEKLRKELINNVNQNAEKYIASFDDLAKVVKDYLLETDVSSGDEKDHLRKKLSLIAAEYSIAEIIRRRPKDIEIYHNSYSNIVDRISQLEIEYKYYGYKYGELLELDKLAILNKNNCLKSIADLFEIIVEKGKSLKDIYDTYYTYMNNDKKYSKDILGKIRLESNNDVEELDFLEKDLSGFVEKKYNPMSKPENINKLYEILKEYYKKINFNYESSRYEPVIYTGIDGKSIKFSSIKEKEEFENMIKSYDYKKYDI